MSSFASDRRAPVVLGRIAADQLEIEEGKVAAFLLWNIDGQNRDLLIQSLVRDRDLKIDVVLLVEYYPSKTRSDLSSLLQSDGLVKRSTSERFGVFARLNHGMTRVTTAIGGRVELWNWVPDSGTAGRFALVHGLDRI